MTPRVYDTTYQALKREITSGDYYPGQRLHARSFADKLGTSTSPVTDAMRQLLGENVLEYTPLDAFIIPRVNLLRVQDLYSVNDWLTGRCISDIVSKAVAVAPFKELSDEGTTADKTEHFMNVLAVASQNYELVRQIGNVNDRVRTCRHLEPKLFDDLPTELGRMIDDWNNDKWDQLQIDLTTYHARRLADVALLVSASYREAK